MKKLLILLLPVLLTACPPPAEPQGPTPVVRDTDACDDAEINLKELECKDRNGDPMWINKKGEPFAETCRIAQDEGRIFLDPKCIAAAKTCEEAKSCPPSAE